MRSLGRRRQPHHYCDADYAEGAFDRPVGLGVEAAHSRRDARSWLCRVTPDFRETVCLIELGGEAADRKRGSCIGRRGNRGSECANLSRTAAPPPGRLGI